MEQQRNTDAHYRHHLNNLRRCLLEKCGIGAARDTKYFRESDFPETESKHTLPNLYELGRECPYCQALCWGEKHERPGFCCEKGKVVLEPLPGYPDIFKEMFEDSKFNDNTRAYNNSLAIASIGIREEMLPGFRPCVKIQGKVHHFIGSLLPAENSLPKFAQIFFMTQITRQRIDSDTTRTRS